MGLQLKWVQIDKNEWVAKTGAVEVVLEDLGQRFCCSLCGLSFTKHEFAAPDIASALAEAERLLLVALDHMTRQLKGET